MLPELRTAIPGPRSRALAARLRRSESRNVTFTSSGQPRASGTTYGPAPTFTTSAAALRCGNLSDNTIIPDGKRHAFLLTAEHQLTDNFKMSMELNHSYYSTESLGGRQTLNIVVPRTNPYFAANVPPAYANNANVFVIHRHSPGTG